MNQQTDTFLGTGKIWLALWLVLFSLIFAWRIPNLDAFGLSNDEGAHLMWARLAQEGYPLYQETQAVQAPLFIESVGWAFRLGGQTIEAGRWVALLGFSLLALALSWLAYRAGGWPAALTTVLLLGLSPLIFRFSRLVMAEVPATALAVTAVVLVLRYIETGSKGWLVASGLALGLSFVVKAINPFVAVPIGLLLLIHHSLGHSRSLNGQQSTGELIRRLASFDKQWGKLWLDAVWWGLGFCLPLAGLFLLYEPAAVYDQLIVFRDDLRSAIPGSWAETGQQFGEFAGSHWGYWLLALGGVISIWLRLHAQKAADIETPDLSAGSTRAEQSVRQGLSFVLYNLVWSIWLVAGVAMLAWHTPLFPHHFIVLLPPLILLGAGSITNLMVLWGNRATYKPALRAVVITLLLTVVVAAFNAPAMVRANQETAAIVTGGREQEGVRLLQAVSNPVDFLMGDSQLLIFMAGRRTPPPLGDVALVAIKANRQSSARMIRLTEAYESPAVVQWSLRLPWLPEYLDWVEANYLARQVWDNDHIIYFGRRIPAGQPVPNEQFVRLAEKVVLRGYQIDSNVSQAGQDLDLKVFWQAEAALTEDYTVFTQLLDRQGRLAASRDSQPLGGYFSTSRWPVGEIVTDVVHLPLPVDLPAGEYSLITGMYLLETLERLPVVDNGNDYVTLTTITIEE